MKKPEYIIGLILAVAVLVGGAVLYYIPTSQTSVVGDGGEPYKEIADPAGFVNVDSIRIGDLIGKKVVLVDFMTYSCINCQRTFPYIVSWYQKYSDEGLEIVGIHTPEFAFEKDIGNVRAAMEEFDITYPVVLDNNYATWRAYGNNYWPRKYLIDIHGNIVYDHIGEGAYAETEENIQDLLRKRAVFLSESVGADTAGPMESVAGERMAARSPEVYFGSTRNEYLGNGPRGVSGRREFSLPISFEPNVLYFDGVWNIQPEYAESVGKSSIVFRYDARDVYIVASGKEDATVTILRDGKSVGEFAGVDVEAGMGRARIGGERLYKLIHEDVLGEHTLEIRIESGTVRAYTFTFG